MKTIIIKILFVSGLLALLPHTLTSQDRIGSAGSITVSPLLGIDVRYEQHIAGNFTLLATAGYKYRFTLGWEDFQIEPDWDEFIFIPFALEARYYYNTGRRLKMGESIKHNAASFVSVEYIPWFRSQEEYRNRIYDYIISPTWGLSRVYGKHWLLEAATGVSLYFGKGYTGSTRVAFGPKLSMMFGFVF